MKIHYRYLRIATLFLLAGLVGCDTDAPTAQAPVAADIAPSEASDATDAVAAAAPAWPTAPLIDPNTATEATLSAIPGLDADAVQAVLAARPFATPSELHAAVSALVAEDTLKSVYKRMFVKVDLNAGAEEDFRLVPSSLSARKLAHEFEEYRPYASIDDFVREMKKYVSDEEVAYLTRFVIVQ